VNNVEQIKNLKNFSKSANELLISGGDNAALDVGRTVKAIAVY